jgi:hypothetical protein
LFSVVALLDECHHDKLVTLHVCLTRKEIDRRNSINKKDDIWQCISDMFNDPLWVPRSCIFSKLQFCHEIALSLPNNADAMTLDKAKTIVKNLWGKYKKAISGWHASFKSKEGKAENGKKIILLIRGTDYNLDPSPEESNKSTQIKYIDDDCSKFVDGNLTTAYMWGMVEQCGLSSFCMQNLGIFVLENGKALSAKGGELTLSSLKRILLCSPLGRFPVKSNRS